MKRVLWWLPRIIVGIPLCVLFGLVVGPVDAVREFFATVRPPRD